MSQPTPASLSPCRNGTNADIAVDPDAPSSPESDPSPHRLQYGLGDEKKRIPSPNRDVDGVSSPPKSRRNTGATPSRIATARGRGIAVDDVFDLFAVEERPPRSVTLSPVQSKRLSSIIASIRKKPLGDKCAILRRRRRTRTTKPKVTRKIQPSVKAPAAKNKKSTSKASILKSTLLTCVRKDVFKESEKGASYFYSTAEMKAHDMKFQTQLKFRFDAKRQSTTIKEAKATTRSVVAEDLDSNDAAF